MLRKIFTIVAVLVVPAILQAQIFNSNIAWFNTPYNPGFGSYIANTGPGCKSTVSQGGLNSLMFQSENYDGFNGIYYTNIDTYDIIHGGINTYTLPGVGAIGGIYMRSSDSGNNEAFIIPGETVVNLSNDSGVSYSQIDLVNYTAAPYNQVYLAQNGSTAATISMQYHPFNNHLYVGFMTVDPLAGNTNRYQFRILDIDTNNNVVANNFITYASEPQNGGAQRYVNSTVVGSYIVWVFYPADRVQFNTLVYSRKLPQVYTQNVATGSGNLAWVGYDAVNLSSVHQGMQNEEMRITSDNTDLYFTVKWPGVTMPQRATPYKNYATIKVPYNPNFGVGQQPFMLDNANPNILGYVTDLTLMSNINDLNPLWNITSATPSNWDPVILFARAPRADVNGFFSLAPWNQGKMDIIYWTPDQQASSWTNFSGMNFQRARFDNATGVSSAVVSNLNEFSTDVNYAPFTLLTYPDFYGGFSGYSFSHTENYRMGSYESLPGGLNLGTACYNLNGPGLYQPIGLDFSSLD